MQKQLTILIVLALSTLVLFSQPKKVVLKGITFTTDQFGNYYDINDVEIKKFNIKGELQYTYSNNLLGKIASVDVSSPMKIIVYFRDFTKILILDNTLSPTSTVIDLTQLNLEETSLVCRSYNNGMWYYNPLRFELIRKNQDLTTSNTSANLSNLLNKNIQPNFLVEHNNNVYLNDPKNGILIFDNFGTYLKTIPIYGLSTFQIKEKFIIFIAENSSVMTYDFLSLEIQQYELTIQEPIKSVRLEGKYIYLQTKKNELLIDKIN
ncbi:MAG: hypothetical protein CMD31_07165 [Flavobacteriales bacterium]|nr:hypothetical protein [Flavobacteriales bacterium]|tara:strand:- start:4872 stop:5663 length:792 start_codon:yes stop_codon:yes gene_type:complete